MATPSTPATTGQLLELPGGGRAARRPCPVVVFYGVDDYIRDAIDRRVGKLLHRLGVGVGGGAGRAGAVSLQPDRHRRLGAAGA